MLKYADPAKITGEVPPREPDSFFLSPRRRRRGETTSGMLGSSLGSAQHARSSVGDGDGDGVITIPTCLRLFPRIGAARTKEVALWRKSVRKDPCVRNRALDRLFRAQFAFLYNFE